MNDPTLTLPDNERSRLRALVAAVEHDMERLPKEEKATPSGLLTSWAALVEALMLGPEPEVRACPVCQKIGMRAATRCSFCWAKITPPTEEKIAAK